MRRSNVSRNESCRQKKMKPLFQLRVSASSALMSGSSSLPVADWLALALALVGGAALAPSLGAPFARPGGTHVLDAQAPGLGCRVRPSGVAAAEAAATATGGFGG